VALVPDVSAILSQALDDEDASFGEAVISAIAATDAVVPTLFWFEIRKALVMAERRKRIRASRTTDKERERGVGAARLKGHTITMYQSQGTKNHPFMNGMIKEPGSKLSLLKIMLFSLACIIIFIAVALVCGLLTSWIPGSALRIAVREIVLRAPLTIMALHFFAAKVIRNYHPDEIYGNVRFRGLLKWTALAFILPVAAGLSYYLLKLIIPIQHSAPLGTDKKISLLITWVSVSIAAGLTEEVLFRGHLFMIFAAGYSKVKAVVITSLIFGLVHIAMLTAFSVSDILTVIVGGSVAGLMFALIYHYTKVIWYAAVVHVVWDIFFVGKITAIAATQAEANQIIVPFRLATHNALLTGGSFGIEAGLPCFVIYLLVIGVLYMMMKRKIGSLRVASV
jgi:membrane protease YdiL (CAAX protease family)